MPRLINLFFCGERLFMTWLKPITLQSNHAKLVPLAHQHHDGLVEAVKDGKLWNLSYSVVPHPQEMKEEITKRLSLLSTEKMLPFTVIHIPTNKIVGMTTYCQVDTANKRLDIGFAWYAKSHWRTALNTECKRLLLTHAFEGLNCIAVGFRVDALNHRSQNAVKRLGAIFEGAAVVFNMKVQQPSVACCLLLAARGRAATTASTSTGNAVSIL
jgi:N-acetyltransferase